MTQNSTEDTERLTRPTASMGQSVPRREDDRLLRGRGRYVADLVDLSTLQVAFLRATEASARIVAVDTAQVAEMPGVVTVITGQDLVGKLGGIGVLHEPHPTFVEAFDFEENHPQMTCLPTSYVAYVGQLVAMVVAESRAEAEDAVEAIDVTYETTPPIVDIDDALARDAQCVHPGLQHNRAASLEAGFGDIATERATAAHCVEMELRMGRHGGIPIETRGVLADWDQRDQRVQIWTSTQVPHMVKTAICRATGWADREVRVTAPDVGGGFGPKANVYPEELLVAYAARLLQRRVAWIEDRAEHFLATAQGRDQRLHGRLDIDDAGHIRAWELDFVADVGAGSLWVAGIIANTALHALGPYRIPAYHTRGTAVFTNKTIVAQYRGAGRPEACFALERCLDAAAEKAGITRAEIRRRNVLRQSDLPQDVPLPYRDGIPITYDASDFGACLDKALEGVSDDRLSRVARQHPRLHVGGGVATYVEATGRGPFEGASVRLTADGRFEAGSGSASAGQSHETTFAQVAADALGVDMAQVTVRNGDTDYVPFGIGSFGSRSAVVAGSAIHQACVELRNRAAQVGAKLLDTSPAELAFSPTGLADPGGARLSWAELAEELSPTGRLAEHGPLHVTQAWSPPTVTWTMGAHAAIVGVDPDTGHVQVLDYTVVHEGGREINPQVVLGQVQGGVAQGIGGALLEEITYNQGGQPESASFAHYLVPGTHEIPEVDVVHLAGRAQLNPLGIKGVGESGTIPVYALLASAIEDALRVPAGTFNTTPMRPAVVHAQTVETAG